MSTQKNRHTRRQIKYSDPGKILDLILAEECESELALLIIVNVDRMEACIDAVGATPLPRKRKISMPQRLIDILNSVTDVMEPFEAFAQDFRSIVEPYIMKDSQKKRFSMFAIRDKTFSVIACLLAPKIQEEHVTVYVNECFLFAWPTFKKAILLEHESTLKTKCQQLLRVTRRLFSQVASMDTLLNIAMEQAKQLTRAEHCRVMLIDPHKMELVDSKSERAGELSRFPLNKGIVGQVITTGRLVNAKVAKDHPAFDPEIDSRPEIDCKMILCFPIREQSGIIGVGQLMNKEGDPYFDGMDEELALAFSIYCGVCIIHSMVYQKIQEANIRNTLANELVMYHMKVSDAEVSRMVECAGFHGHPYLHSLHFNIRMLPLRELPCYALRMFHDLGFHKKFDIKTEKLVRFILHVKKGYRDVPYHNWLHAFSVAQWAYAAMIKFRLISEGYLTDLQALMYLVAGLVHDLDHRGTTNSFHMQGQTTLAALYSSEGSVMERHHLAQAMCILNTEGCDILESLPRRDYDRALLLLRDYILATDLANYFKNLNDYKAIALDFHPGNRVHASALQALLMNAADLSDQLMDWGSIKKTAAAVLTEFFKQGDVEKSRGDLPSAIMDREKCIIPELEMQFLETTCIPLFEILSVILPRAQPCIKILENHRERWDHALPIFKEVPVSAGLSILLSPELDNLIEVSFKERERQRIEDEAAAAAAAAATAAELE